MPLYGCCIKATAAVSEGDLLFSIPQKLMLSVETARNSSIGTKWSFSFFDIFLMLLFNSRKFYWKWSNPQPNAECCSCFPHPQWALWSELILEALFRCLTFIVWHSSLLYSTGIGRTERISSIRYHKCSLISVLDIQFTFFPTVDAVKMFRNIARQYSYFYSLLQVCYLIDKHFSFNLMALVALQANKEPALANLRSNFTYNDYR